MKNLFNKLFILTNLAIYISITYMEQLKDFRLRFCIYSYSKWARFCGNNLSILIHEYSEMKYVI